MLIEQLIMVWPNYDWCYPDNLEEELITHSDDYMELTVIISNQLDTDTAIEEYLAYYKPQG